MHLDNIISAVRETVETEEHPTQRHDPTIMPVSDNCRGSGLWQDRRMDAVSSYNETPRMASA